DERRLQTVSLGSTGRWPVVRGSLPRTFWLPLRVWPHTFGRLPNAIGWQPVFPGPATSSSCDIWLTACGVFVSGLLSLLRGSDLLRCDFWPRAWPDATKPCAKPRGGFQV